MEYKSADALHIITQTCIHRLVCPAATPADGELGTDREECF